MIQNLQIRNNLQELYPDIYTHETLSALAALAPFNREIKEAMASRIKRREDRNQNKTRITFLDPEDFIPRTGIKVKDARNGNFEGAVIPEDLQ